MRTQAECEQEKRGGRRSKKKSQSKHGDSAELELITRCTIYNCRVVVLFCCSHFDQLKLIFLHFAVQFMALRNEKKERKISSAHQNLSCSKQTKNLFFFISIALRYFVFFSLSRFNRPWVLFIDGSVYNVFWFSIVVCLACLFSMHAACISIPWISFGATMRCTVTILCAVCITSGN